MVHCRQRLAVETGIIYIEAMAILKNARQEKFCQELSQGKTQEQAYAAAGYKKLRQNASRLMTNALIRERVAELQSRNVEKQDAVVEITTARLVAMAEEARVLAMELGQPAAAVTAITALAKLSGKWIEKSETTTKTGDLSQLTDGELEAIIRSSNETKSTLN